MIGPSRERVYGLARMSTQPAIEAFKAKWLGSQSAERSNSQLFLTELTDLMGVPHPSAAVNDPAADTYVFERKVQLAHSAGERVGWIDLYKAGCFVLESKQGAHEGSVASRSKGFAKRDTPGWENEMEKARGQAKGYAQTLAEPPPFILVCDVGHVFEIHSCFDGSAHWTAFPEPPANRIYLKTLDEQKLATLRTIWTDPLSLDPTRNQARVSRAVAESLAELARALEAQHTPEAVARFLMRCIFSMFAEDIGLFPGKKKLFQEYLEKYWIKSPAGFPAGCQAFWSKMNTGGPLMTGETLKRFNGGLFADPSALPLDGFALSLLLEAVKHDWSQVEPAIFGTLLERALDPKERHRLGAHYTPRAYVERLVRPTIEEPLRADWLVVQADASRLREAGKVREAAKVLSAFHQKLCAVKVLDPACGSGNFLYVALDLMKRLEAEVREELWRLGDQNELLEFDGITVRPSQFLGIEKKPWAKEIAELVLWIGYLRWHFRAKGDRGEVQVPEPVLEKYDNIECRDAVLEWDGPPGGVDVKDERGVPVTRWDGETTKADPITGMQVPDESHRMVLKAYPNARRAEWPEADFIVGNPPFVGGWLMRKAFGDGYVDAYRAVYPELPEKSDFVMTWWTRAAEIVAAGAARRFGLITTNSITQHFSRRVVARHLDASQGIRLVFAIPDHPWVDEAGAANVRIAMTVGESKAIANDVAYLVEVIDEVEGEVTFATRSVDAILADLSGGAAIGSAVALASNGDVASPGMQLFGAGFLVTPEQAQRLSVDVQSPVQARVVRPFLNGRDISGQSRGLLAIDFAEETPESAAQLHPAAFQWLLTHVKPERDANKQAYLRDRWWLFGRERLALRNAIGDQARYIATPETAKHRCFVFMDKVVLPDNSVIAIAMSDAFALGVLSSKVHVTWALAAGGTLEDRPRYTKIRCFDTFPFPDANEAQKATIRELAEKLDAHRKRQLAAHPKLTITGMYNVLEKLRAGDALNDKDKVIHETGLVSLLKQLHDELDGAVLEAYGWPAGLSDEELLERLVALNAERAAEEAAGHVRWLRPDFQAPKAAPTQVALPGARPSQPPPAIPAAAKPAKWPTAYTDKVALIRDLVFAAPRGATFSVAEVAARFKRAKPADIEKILDAIAGQGFLVAFEAEDETRRWARPARAA